MQRIRILLVDDSLSFLEAAATLIADWPGIELIGCASSGSEALERVPELRPDLVLLNLLMPGIDGLETLRRLKGGRDAPVVMVMTLNDNSATRKVVFALGAVGFIGKTEFHTQALPQIRSLFGRSHGCANDDAVIA
jgi:DNA-binding NarL/FixJ family response regulator